MTVAKIVRVGGVATAEAEQVLATAASAFAEEEGTLHWSVFGGSATRERVLIELFADRQAAAAHDRSSAVEAMLAGFREHGIEVVDVEELDTWSIAAGSVAQRSEA